MIFQQIEQTDLIHMPKTSGMMLKIRRTPRTLRRKQHYSIQSKLRAAVKLEEMGFRIGLGFARESQLIDDWQQQFGMIVFLMTEVFGVAPQDENRIAQAGQQAVLVRIGSYRHLVGQRHGLLTQQHAALHLDNDKNAAQLIQIINAVLQVFATVTIFLKALQTGFSLLNGGVDFGMNQLD